MGTYLIMALIEPIIATIANWFIASNTIGLGITYALVLVFVGLATYDTPKKSKSRCTSEQGMGLDECMQKSALMGIYTLYLDFSEFVSPTEENPSGKGNNSGGRDCFSTKRHLFHRKAIKSVAHIRKFA